MTGRGPSTLAVVIAFIIVLAGMSVLASGGTATAADVDLLPDVGDSQVSWYDGTPASAASASEAVGEQYDVYRALAMYASTAPGKLVRSRADSTSEEAPSSDQRLHRWHCPICDATKLSLGAPTGDPGEEAANNLRSHLRNSDGNGHGPPGTLPPGITNDLIRDSVAVSELVE